MKPTTIIFDWHGVLDHVTLESATSNPLLPIPSILKSLRHDIYEYSAGIIQPPIFWQRVVKRYPLSRFILRQIVKKVTSFQPNVPLWERVPTLSEQYTLAILSDCPADKLAVIYEKADLQLFRAAHFSCEKHLTKNDEAFFLDLTKELKTNPKNCMYIDDSLKNIQTAKKLGFQTHLFKTMEELEAIIR